MPIFKEEKEKLSSWMSKLPSVISKQPLNTIAIPGSHDSFTYSIKPKAEPSPDGDAYNLVRHLPKSWRPFFLHNWVLTQSATAAKQLQGGIRYFDLRVALHKADGQFVIVHGQYGEPVAEVLKPVTDFLRENPREVVLVDMNHCYEFETEADKLALDKALLEVVGPFLYPFRGKIPSLDEMWSSGKSMIFFHCMHEEASEGFWPSSSIRSIWPNTTNVTKMLESLNKTYGPSFKRTANQFLVHQGVLTADSSYVTRNLCGSTLKLSKTASPAFIKWLSVSKRKAGSHGVNITIIDFTSRYFPRYSKAVIQLNYSTWKS